MESIIKDQAEQYYISLPGQSWATFVISEKGDLFINSDWGYWACCWRSFGTDFKKFLIDMNSDYLIMNLTRQQVTHGGKMKIGKRQQEALCIHFEKFQQLLKSGK